MLQSTEEHRARHPWCSVLATGGPGAQRTAHAGPWRASLETVLHPEVVDGEDNCHILPPRQPLGAYRGAPGVFTRDAHPTTIPRDPNPHARRIEPRGPLVAGCVGAVERDSGASWICAE